MTSREFDTRQCSSFNREHVADLISQSGRQIARAIQTSSRDGESFTDYHVSAVSSAAVYARGCTIEESINGMQAALKARDEARAADRCKLTSAHIQTPGCPAVLTMVVAEQAADGLTVFMPQNGEPVRVERYGVTQFGDYKYRARDGRPWFMILTPAELIAVAS